MKESDAKSHLREGFLSQYVRLCTDMCLFISSMTKLSSCVLGCNKNPPVNVWIVAPCCKTPYDDLM